jgi:hypothetical protein
MVARRQVDSVKDTTFVVIAGLDPAIYSVAAAIRYPLPWIWMPWLSPDMTTIDWPRAYGQCRPCLQHRYNRRP